MLPVAILAGGLATRLYPISALVPKALMSVAGRPFIFHQLELLKSQGIERVVLCVGHLGEQVRATVLRDPAPHGLGEERVLRQRPSRAKPLALPVELRVDAHRPVGDPAVVGSPGAQAGARSFPRNGPG